MKKILLLILKIGLFVFFIYNLGILSYLADTKKHPPAPQTENWKEDLDWLDKKYENALKLGEQYSPELYFSDITEIQLKRNKNEFNQQSLNAVNFTLSNLASIFNQNLINIRSKSNNEDIGNYMKRIEIASEKSDEILSPGITEKRKKTALEIRTTDYWFNLLKKLFLWILSQYFKNILPAFLLLCIWWYQEKGTWKIKNPLSFVFCLIFYPIVIIKTWGKKINMQTRYFIMTIEYRRRQYNLFSLFSEDEIKEIKKFAKTNISLKNYRENLSQNNFVIKHNFISALAITLIFIVIGEQKSYTQNIVLSNIIDINKIEQLENAPPPTLVKPFLEFETLKSILSDKITNPLSLSRLIKLIYKKEKCLAGFRRSFEHIPKLVINN